MLGKVHGNAVMTIGAGEGAPQLPFSHCFSSPPPPRPSSPGPALHTPGKHTLAACYTIDDMRPEMLGAYGQTALYTPNFDKLANQSMTFTHAYCQVQ